MNCATFSKMAVFIRSKKKEEEKDIPLVPI
jgi:hypothetical protein